MQTTLGQHKNNANTHYLMWRTLTGRHKAATLSFMLVGRTKFAPDRFFFFYDALFAVVFLPCLTSNDASKSPLTQQNRTQLIASVDGKNKYVTWYQWSDFFLKYFKTIPNITSYHNFRVSSINPGIVFLLKFSDSPEIQFNLLKTPQIPDPAVMPETKEPKGLEANHQCFLYEQIRPFCPTTL